jgi:hypothetical protein
MDQHLIAEYCEITMVPAILVRILLSNTGLDYKKIPKSCILNKGHAYFFLWQRFLPVSTIQTLGYLNEKSWV